MKETCWQGKCYASIEPNYCKPGLNVCHVSLFSSLLLLSITSNYLIIQYDIFGSQLNVLIWWKCTELLHCNVIPFEWLFINVKPLVKIKFLTKRRTSLCKQSGAFKGCFINIPSWYGSYSVKGKPIITMAQSEPVSLPTISGMAFIPHLGLAS